VNDRPGPGAPGALATVVARIDRRLDQLLSPEIERWAAVDPDLRPPLTTLRSAVLGGGKRLRPAFCYWSFVGAGGDPDAPLVLDAGAALEMLHAAALIHDDVIDGSDRRHGTDTVHVAYEARHREGSGRGDSARFGTGVAILLGDLALAYSDRLLAGAPPAARAVFDEVRIEVNVGQYLDILGAAERVPTVTENGAAVEAPSIEAMVDRARRICRYKTAKYTVERPLHLGAALAAPAQAGELAGPLSAFGLPLGEAFQLRDDLLCVFGDSSRTGKPVGDDLREGKPTLLVSLARARAASAGARLLAGQVGRPDLSESEVLELRSVIEATGARAEVEATIERLAAAAEAALQTLPLNQEARQALGELADYATGRDH
jgi:geranylgeranyl diphosphate synthase type I